MIVICFFCFEHLKIKFYKDLIFLALETVGEFAIPALLNF